MKRRFIKDPDFAKRVGKSTSKTCLEKSARGEWHTSLAKNMHKNYNGIDLHGNWELAYAMYLDRNGIKWERPNIRINYIFEDKSRHYTPDFYLVDTNQYIEIKGFEVEKDSVKWSTTRDQGYELVVYKQKELKELFSNDEDLLKML